MHAIAIGLTMPKLSYAKPRPYSTKFTAKISERKCAKTSRITAISSMTPGEKWANVQADEKSDDLQSCVASTGGELTGQGLPQSLRFSLPVANWPLQSQSQSVHSSRQLRTSMSQRPCECLRSDRPVWRSAGRPASARLPIMTAARRTKCYVSVVVSGSAAWTRTSVIQWPMSVRRRSRQPAVSSLSGISGRRSDRSASRSSRG